MRRTTCIAVLVCVGAVFALSLAPPVSAGDVPTIMQLSPSEENVTAGDEFEVDLVLTSDGGGYGDVEVRSVDATLSYGEGVTVEDVRYGSWFEDGDVAPERSHTVDADAREVRFEQSLESGDTGMVETYAPVVFVADTDFDGKVALEVSELNVTLTDGNEMPAVPHSDSVEVRSAEDDGLPMAGFGVVAALTASLAVSVRRLRGQHRLRR